MDDSGIEEVKIVMCGKASQGETLLQRCRTSEDLQSWCFLLLKMAKLFKYCFIYQAKKTKKILEAAKMLFWRRILKILWTCANK